MNQEDIRVEVSVSALYRRRIEQVALEAWRTRVQFAVGGDLQHHFDGALAAALATLVLEVIGTVVTLKDRAESVKDRAESSRWTWEEVRTRVREEAAREIGDDAIYDVRYEGLGDFLDGRSGACRVVADVHDETYEFEVFRDGDVIVVKLS